MSKHGQEYNENLTQKEMFEMGRKYEREQMAKHNEVEGLVLELGRGTKVTLYTGLTLEKRHLEMIDQAFTTHSAKEYERGRDAVVAIVDSRVDLGETVLKCDDWKEGRRALKAEVHQALPQTDVTKN